MIYAYKTLDINWNAIILGFTALSSLDPQVTENWMVHCFSCIG